MSLSAKILPAFWSTVFGFTSMAVYADAPDINQVFQQQPASVEQPLQNQPTQPEVKQEEVKKEEEKPGYKIVYHKHSKKQPELINKKVRGQLYKFNNPYKRFEVKTSESGQIHFDPKDLHKQLAVSLYYIEGEEKLKVRCQGNALPGKMEIQVRCE